MTCPDLDDHICLISLSTNPTVKQQVVELHHLSQSRSLIKLFQSSFNQGPKQQTVNCTTCQVPLDQTPRYYNHSHHLSPICGLQASVHGQTSALATDSTLPDYRR